MRCGHRRVSGWLAGTASWPYDTRRVGGLWRSARRRKQVHAVWLQPCVGWRLPTKVFSFTAGNQRAEAIFLDRYTELGIPIGVKGVICSLLRGDVEEALAILTHWKT